jgi:hypothetical protein
LEIAAEVAELLGPAELARLRDPSLGPSQECPACKRPLCDDQAAAVLVVRVSETLVIRLAHLECESSGVWTVDPSEVDPARLVDDSTGATAQASLIPVERSPDIPLLVVATHDRVTSVGTDGRRRELGEHIAARGLELVEDLDVWRPRPIVGWTVAVGDGAAVVAAPDGEHVYEGGRPSKPERGNGAGPRWFDRGSVNCVMLDCCGPCSGDRAPAGLSGLDELEHHRQGEAPQHLVRLPPE